MTPTHLTASHEAAIASAKGLQTLLVCMCAGSCWRSWRCGGHDYSNDTFCHAPSLVSRIMAPLLACEINGAKP
jgi:hypothetical protein